MRVSNTLPSSTSNEQSGEAQYHRPRHGTEQGAPKLGRGPGRTGALRIATRDPKPEQAIGQWVCASCLVAAKYSVAVALAAFRILDGIAIAGTVPGCWLGVQVVLPQLRDKANITEVLCTSGADERAISLATWSKSLRA
jgi:hypothetical protein